MTAWMIRAGRSGIFASEWLEKGKVAIYWDLDGFDIAGKARCDIKAVYAHCYPDASPREVAAGTGQIYRFACEMVEGSTIVMYDPSTRLYNLGAIAGPCVLTSEDESYSYQRAVEWERIASRDALMPSSKNALGAISTIFAIAPDALADLLRAAEGGVGEGDMESVSDADDADVRNATFDDGIERIKDRVLALSWGDMELLVAGLLRAMGYKTSMTKKGSDGGRDVIASPDGLGLESPRIIVEVKHRKGPMSAPMIRAFVGGLRASDSGLYVSTGGFTKEAHYEADRATVPLRLLDLDQFVRVLVDNYETVDAEAKAILPLTRIYWPV